MEINVTTDLLRRLTKARELMVKVNNPPENMSEVALNHQRRLLADQFQEIGILITLLYQPKKRD